MLNVRQHFQPPVQIQEGEKSKTVLEQMEKDVYWAPFVTFASSIHYARGVITELMKQHSAHLKTGKTMHDIHSVLREAHREGFVTAEAAIVARAINLEKVIHFPGIAMCLWSNYYLQVDATVKQIEVVMANSFFYFNRLKNKLTLPPQAHFRVSLDRYLRFYQNINDRLYTRIYNQFKIILASNIWR